ncbi:hypothetical protein BYT27DRAFT_7343967 [Phlegmacium glaucopus]|nr:hypothetical protein BYT27DRAFT_7343967 [Phlegmacium glaucopus]
MIVPSILAFVFLAGANSQYILSGRFKVVEPDCGYWINLAGVVMSMTDLGKDTLLARYGTQYRIASHLWMALHAELEQNSLMAQHTDEACRLIEELLAGGADSGDSETIKPKGFEENIFLST